MALIKCPECGKEVSDAAKSCPHCGYPLKETTTTNTTYIDSKASRIITKDHKVGSISSIVVSSIAIIASIAVMLTSTNPSYESSRTEILLGGGFLLLLSIASLIVSIYKLTRY